MSAEQDLLFRLIETCRRMANNPKCEFGDDRDMFLGLMKGIGDDFATKQYLVQRQVLEDAKLAADNYGKDIPPDKTATDKVVQAIDSLLTNPDIGWGSGIDPVAEPTDTKTP